jgi:hypothetical protein
MKVEEFFGTLQESVVMTWRKHLKTKKYSSHMALDEYYKEAPELIDALIEAWQGTHDKVENYENLLKDKTFETAVDYLTELRKITKEGRELMDSSELESDVDSILSLIDGVIYKLKELKEDYSLVDFLHEKMVAESSTSLRDMTDYASSWIRQAWNERDVKNVIVAVINGLYRELSERQTYESTSDKEKQVANVWLDKIEEMIKIIEKK